MTDTAKKSKFSYGGKNLSDLTNSELLEAIAVIWQSKNDEIAALKATEKALKKLLESPLPIHSLWRSFGENAMLFICIAMLAYSLGAK